jgi:hypothetical protein
MAKNSIQIWLESFFNPSGFEAAEGKASGFGDVMGGVNKLLGAFGLALGAKELFDFGVAAEQSARALESARAKLVPMVGGLGAYNDLMAQAKTVTNGMVSETDLANSAFITLQMGLAKTGQEAIQLANAGAVLSTAFEAQGASVELFNRLLASGSQILLDNFGISQAQVNARKAELIAAQGLSEEEARLQAIRDIAIQKAQDLQGVMTQNEVAAKNLTAAYTDFSAMVTPAVEDAKSGLASLLTSATAALKGQEEQSNINIRVAQKLGMSYDRFRDAVKFGLIPQEKLKQVTAEVVAVMDREQAALANKPAVLAMYQRSTDAAAASVKTLAEAEAELAQRLQDTSTARWEGIAAQEAGQTWKAGARETPKQWLDNMLPQPEEISAGMSSVADTLSNAISSVIQPTLSEVWQAPEDAARIDEWARRMADVATNGLGSQWAPALQQQFAGQSFMQPFFDAMAGGDNEAAKAAATQILTNNITQLWDVNLIKQRVREQLQQQNARQALIDQIQQELGSEGIVATTGAIAVAAGDASAKQEENKAQMDSVKAKADETGKGIKAAFDAAGTSIDNLNLRIDKLIEKLNAAKTAALGASGSIAGLNPPAAGASAGPMSQLGGYPDL